MDTSNNEIDPNNSFEIVKIKNSIKIKRDLVSSLKKSLELIKESVNEDIETHQKLCKHKFVLEREPYERSIRRCIYCGFC